MPRSEEAEHWYNAVCLAVQQIPYGKITTYKHIAVLLDEPQRSRQVGICLKHLPSRPSADGDEDEDGNADGGESPFFHDANVPWHRVINSQGMVSKREPGGAERQAAALSQEGVELTVDAMGEIYVDLPRHGWFPLELPQEI